jgi:hypothetical protein
MAEELFEFVDAGAVVEIAHHDQAVALVQMRIDPLAQPEALGQLLAAVLDGKADLRLAADGAVGVLRLGMDADQAQFRGRAVVTASSSGGFEKRIDSLMLSASRS